MVVDYNKKQFMHTICLLFYDNEDILQKISHLIWSCVKQWHPKKCCKFTVFQLARPYAMLSIERLVECYSDVDGGNFYPF